MTSAANPLQTYHLSTNSKPCFFSYAYPVSKPCVIVKSFSKGFQRRDRAGVLLGVSLLKLRRFGCRTYWRYCRDYRCPQCCSRTNTTTALYLGTKYHIVARFLPAGLDKGCRLKEVLNAESSGCWIDCACSAGTLSDVCRELFSVVCLMDAVSLQWIWASASSWDFRRFYWSGEGTEQPPIKGSLAILNRAETEQKLPAG